MGIPILSIYVPVYNHEKYIARALDSILMQETSYEYEVLVGEDASTDASKQVLLEYEEKHPNRIQVFYREHNLSREKIGNGLDLRLRGQGKYCIMLEGDDYWIDKHKIQRQIDFLEANSEYIAVGHDCCVVGENDELLEEEYPFCRDNEYNLGHLAAGLYPGQTATLMVRNWLKYPFFDDELLCLGLSPSDFLMAFSFSLFGRIYCIQEKMSAYRHVVHSGSSYSARHKTNRDYEMKYYSAIMNYAERINNKGGIICSEYLFYRCLFRLCIREKLMRREEAIYFFRKIKHPCTIIRMDMKRYYNTHVTKRQGSIMKDKLISYEKYKS